MTAQLEERIKLLEYLSRFVSENKRDKFDQIIKDRTRYLTIVLEDIYQPHNASAVLRSCDCFGVQDVHIIENNNKYQVNPDVALGSSKWLTLKKYNEKENNTIPCLKFLKEQGYTIVATTPQKNDYDIDRLPLDNKIALVFGTEMRGLTTTAIEMADQCMKIPMVGFTESFNISVSAALSMFYLTGKIRDTELPWELSREEKVEVLLNWVRNVVKRADLLEEKFLSGYNPPPQQ